MAKSIPKVYSYITTEETQYKTVRIPIVEGYEWNMYEHIKKSTLYKNSQYESGKPHDKPFKNIIRPILNVAYRTEGFDVRDIEPYVNDEKQYFKSFLVRKFHNRWAIKNGIDNFIDDLVESYVDYGGVVVKNVFDKKPEVVPLQRFAFVDQTDIVSGAKCEKHAYSIDQLTDMKSRWYPDGIETAITMARSQKAAPSGPAGKPALTPGKYIEVYELHGTFPESWLDKGDTDEDGNPVDPDNFFRGDENKYVSQIHVVTFYKSTEADAEKDSEGRVGITLYAGRERGTNYKVLLRDKIYNRALGFGGIEELFDPQIWTNYSIIQIKEMLDKAALMILQTADKAFASRNKIDDLQKGEILVHEENMPVSQISFTPQNIEKFNEQIDAWNENAQTTGAAQDALLGEPPSSGTPFKLQNLVVQEGRSLHDWRRGKIAVFMENIYRDWILPEMVDDMNVGHKFIEELSLDELQSVAENVVDNWVNKKVKERILKGQIIKKEDVEAFRQLEIQKFIKSGSKRFLEIMEGEMKDIPMEVTMNIAGKQKNLDQMTDKLVNIFRAVVSNPDVLKNPAMARLFNNILETSGLDPQNFTGFTTGAPAAAAAPAVPANPAAPNPTPPVPAGAGQGQ